MSWLKAIFPNVPVWPGGRNFSLWSFRSFWIFWAMSKWSEFAWPSIKYVQSKSLPEVHSPLASEPNTTKLVSSDVYLRIPADKSSSSSSRVLDAASRAVGNGASWRSSETLAIVFSAPVIVPNCSNVCPYPKLRASSRASGQRAATGGPPELDPDKKQFNRLRIPFRKPLLLD